MNKLKNKNEKGITLIALVITIIVLLILAGVAINMAINSDGLFAKSKEAAEGWNTAAEKERTEITNLLEIANNVGGNSGGGNNDDDDDTSTLPAGWDATKVANIVKETVTVNGEQITRNAPIPVGYVASQITADEDGKGAENTIADGLVIYQGTDPVTGVAGSEAHTTAMTTRNQYVWIPVDDINQMVMCKSNASGSVCNLDLVNGVLQCTNTAHSANATNLCGRLYQPVVDTSGTSRTAIMNFSDRTQTWPTDMTSNTSYREPDVISYDTETNTSALGGLTAFGNQLTADFNAMATSVAKYGGFYVSRYEAGVDGASKKNQIVITAANEDGTVYKGVSAWYGLYNAVRSSTSNTHMIYGCQYDQIINFIGAEGQTAHSDRKPTLKKLTGGNTSDIMNNIYDLENNNLEWTALAYNAYCRVFRGGFQTVDGTSTSTYAASEYSVSASSDVADDDFTTRISLYL